MNKLLRTMWISTRFLPGAFQISQHFYKRRFLVPERVSESPDISRSKGFRLLLLCPLEELSSSNFKAAGGNIYFEIFQSARERYGETNVHFADIAIFQNVDELELLCRELEISHLMVNPETPEAPETWEMPRLICLLNSKLDLRYWFFLFDAVHWDHLFKVNFLCEKVARSVTLAIDVDIKRRLSKNSAPAGPACLPISRASIEKLPAEPCAMESLQKISFLGKLYDYRFRALSKLATKILAVNPHKTGAELPAYESYMQALWQSSATLNFAQASSYRTKQLKSRVLEAAIVGCPVVTDDGGLAARYLGDKDLVVTVKRPKGLLSAIRSKSIRGRALAIDRAKLMNVARSKASNRFWEMFEEAERTRAPKTRR